MSQDFSRFKSRWLILDFFVACILFIVGFAILGVFLSLLTGFDLDNLENIENNEIFLGIFGVSFYTYFGFKLIKRLKISQIQPKQIIGNLSVKNIPWLFLLIIFYAEFTLASGISNLSLFIVNLFSPALVEAYFKSSEEMLNYHSSSILMTLLNFIFLAFSLIIIAPVAEEFIFRGVLLSRWSTKWGISWGIIISSLVFGLIHVNIAFLSQASMGLVWALLYLQTNRLIIPMILHAMHNGYVLINSMIYDISYPNDSDYQITLYTFWTGLVRIILAVVILRHFLKWPDKSSLLPYIVNQKNTKNKSQSLN